MVKGSIRQYKEGYRYKTGYQPVTQLVYLMEGELLLSSPGQWVRLEKGFVGVLPKGSSFYLECTRDFRGLYIVIEEDFNHLKSKNTMGLEGDTAIKVIAELLRIEFSKELLSTSVMQSLFESFAELTNRLLAKETKTITVQNTSQMNVQKAEQKLQDNLYSNLPVEKVLEGLGIGYRQISRYFLELKGESPKQFFIKLKMKEVCRLLKESTYSVTTIAHELGFASSQHLSTQFKQIFGDTPKNWQRIN